MDMELKGGQEALNSLNELDFLTQEQLLMGAMKIVARRSVASPLRTAMPYSPEMKKNIGIFTNNLFPYQFGQVFVRVNEIKIIQNNPLKE